MQLYKTTHETDWRRVQWVHDTSHETRGSYAYDTEAFNQAAEDHESEGLNNGTLVVLGAIVQTKCLPCGMWQDQDSLWGIVVKVNEDLEAYGTECLNIPDKPETEPDPDCEESPSGDTERRQIPLSDRAMDYVESARQTPPEDPPKTVMVYPMNHPDRWADRVRELTIERNGLQDKRDDLIEEKNRVETSRDAAVFREGLASTESSELRKALLSIADMAANDYDMTKDPGFEAIETMARKAVD